MGVVDNISTELTNIRDATYGEQVRGSIHDGIKKIAQEVDATVAEIDSSNPVIVRKAIAPYYDSNDQSVVYNVGDYVYHLDNPPTDAPSLYRCQTPTTGGVDFPGSPPNWVKATLGNDINRSEINQYRFDSASGPGILAGKSCDDLTRPGVWYVNKVDDVSTLTDFPIDGPGWIRISGPNSGRLMQEVYPSDIETYSYRLFRTKDTRIVDGVSTTAWTDWYKVPLIPEDGHWGDSSMSVIGTGLNFDTDGAMDIALQIAEPFTDNVSYAIGDLVVKDNVLYKFTSNHAAGAWTGNDVVYTSVADEIDGKIDISQGVANAGKALVVNSSGNVEPGDIGIDSKADADMIAPEFDDEDSYTAGQYVYKNGVLYRFTAAHSGAWTGTDVEAATVGSELIEVKTVLNNNLNCTKTTGFTIGKHIVSAGNIGDIPTLSEVTNGNFHSKIIECNEGDVFSITGSGGYTPRLWTFVDENGMILGNSAGGAVANNLILVAPKCTNRLVINFDISLNPTPSLYAGESIDDRVKNKLYAETYYSEVSYTKSRNYDTDCYFVTIPKVTNNNCVIGISIEKDNNRSPLERAQYNGSTVTINCGMALKQLNETNAVGNIIGNGVVLNSNNIDISQTVPNSVGYLTIARDRSFKTYTIDTTLAELEQDGVENCFTFYYPLVLNDTIQSFDNVICNEDGVALVRHPRSAIGIKSDGTIVLFSCDGRDRHNLGLSSSAVATVLKAKGCSNAWMLDGGGSSSLVYHGEKMNRNMDGYGTVDRLITTTFNVTSPSKLKSINSLQTSVGSAKQRLIQQIMPSITGTKNEVNEFMELLGFVKLEYSYGFINAYYSTIDITKVNYTASYQYILQPCSAGDVFYVTGRGTYSALVWAFIDESGNSLTKANENDDLKNHRIVAPANTAYVLIQANDSYDHAAYMKIDGVF